MAKNQSQSEVNFGEMSDREKWDYGPSNERAAAALAVNFFFTEAYGKIDADQSGFVTQNELKAATANTNLSREQRQTRRLSTKTSTNSTGLISTTKPWWVSAKLAISQNK